MRTIQRPQWVAAAAALSLFLLAGSGCSSSAPASAGDSPPAATAPKPQLGSFGFDATGMDREVKPGDDFFEFVNGTWVRNTEIPADRASYGTFVMIHERVERDVRAIVEGAASDTAASGDRRKIGDAFTAFMDEARIESLGLTPLKHELEAIAAIDDRTALARLFGR